MWAITLSIVWIKLPNTWAVWGKKKEKALLQKKLQFIAQKAKVPRQIPVWLIIQLIIIQSQMWLSPQPFPHTVDKVLHKLMPPRAWPYEILCFIEYLQIILCSHQHLTSYFTCIEKHQSTKEIWTFKYQSSVLKKEWLNTYFSDNICYFINTILFQSSWNRWK